MRRRSTWSGWIALVIVLLAPGAAHAAVSFSSTAYPLPTADSEYHSRLGAVSVVDLNTDGHPDIAVYRGGGNVGRLYVLLNQGTGTFAPALENPSCANPDGGTMVTGQFNVGTAADIILGCEAGTGPEDHLGAGDGTFASSTHYPGIGLNNVIALWPGDEGATPDLLFGILCSSCPPPGGIALCQAAVDDLGNAACLPDTSATESNGDPGGHASIGPSLATAHFYANAQCPRDDLILSPYLRAVRAWGLNPFGNPSPRLGPCESLSYTERAVQGIPGTENLTHISTGDLNGDGIPDLLMSTDGSSLVALTWQMGGTDVDGGFPPGQQSVVTPTISGIEDQQVADFDGDGLMDVALVGETSGGTTATLAVQRGIGDGSFATPPVTFAVPGGSPDTYNTIGPNHLAVGDLNGDGKPDVVSIAQGDGSVTVLLNGTPAPTPTPTPTPTPGASGSPSPVPIPSAVPPPPALDTVAPIVSAVTLSNRRFAAGAAATAISASTKRGTTLHYALSERSRVTIAIARQTPGRRKGTRCVIPTLKLRRAKRCTISSLQGTLARTGVAGADALLFSGRIGTRKLRPGRYRMTLTATDAGGNRSKPSLISFAIVRP